jgi:hypothetical protein
MSTIRLLSEKELDVVTGGAGCVEDVTPIFTNPGYNQNQLLFTNLGYNQTQQVGAENINIQVGANSNIQT